MTVAVVVALAAAAAAETLYNGIVLPSEWPPRIDLTNRTTVAEPWRVPTPPTDPTTPRGAH